MAEIFIKSIPNLSYLSHSWWCAIRQVLYPLWINRLRSVHMKCDVKVEEIWSNTLLNFLRTKRKLTFVTFFVCIHRNLHIFIINYRLLFVISRQSVQIYNVATAEFSTSLRNDENSSPIVGMGFPTDDDRSLITCNSEGSVINWKWHAGVQISKKVCFHNYSFFINILICLLYYFRTCKFLKIQSFSHFIL